MIHLINKMDKNHMIISTDDEKESDKISVPDLKKITLNKLGIETTYLNITKTINMTSPQIIS